MLKKFLFILILILGGFAQASAEKILFIPHDDRPVSFQQPVEVVSQLKNYQIIAPSQEILANPDDLWLWLKENAFLADAAVVSSDALLYGGLIPSRSHQISQEILNLRLKNFKILRKNNPNLKIYVFGSLMRTPSFGTPGDIEEPDYYGQFGSNIFQYTMLLDKSETSKLTDKEKIFIVNLEKNIPAEILDDYFARREKNLTITKKILDLACENIINFFVIGRDDNSPLSQTHRESKILSNYMANISKTKAQSLAGIDEFAILLLTRAINDLDGSLPFVNIQFNRGSGAKTIPDFSDEAIGNSIRNEILISGAFFVPNPSHADFVLMVNTAPNGKTFEIYNSFPPQILTKREKKYLEHNARVFSAQVEKAINENFLVGIADITFANGSDNALMNQLSNKNLLFKLQSYAGWNTATNSSGFALGTGILAKKMSRQSLDKLLITRYLDDWAYQANIRTQIAEKLSKQPNGLKIYLHLGENESEIVEYENQLMQSFVEKNLPNLTNFTLSNPWHRMFECKIEFFPL